ncbi:MAG: 2-oxoacid:acceptor oxidoreductase subunit alpha [Coriobacteriia bacterium]|nr:2-oxoacid:acceptor oxidoreductase subunit alpha [Coriobacteriia bacterium]
MATTAPPYGREVRIKVAGPAGAGIKASGETLARSFAKAGLNVFDLTEYPSLIKGGHNVYVLRVSADPITSHVDPVDVLVALDQLTVELNASELVDGGALVYDPDDVTLDTLDARLRERICPVPVRLTQIVKDAGGKPIMRNVAALGAVIGHLDFPLRFLSESLHTQFARKAPEIAEQNVAVAAAGHDAAREAGCAFPGRVEPLPDAPEKLLVDGNESVGLGALAAGIGFYAAYPMTPASPLLHFMARYGADAGVVVKHTEDEIAAMNMVVGAAFGGGRTMCASAGGGFALMVEAFGLAGVSESAVVVGVFSRTAPGTGLPTWTEQADLRYVMHAAPGEFPRVILSPGDMTDCFELAWKAFNLADRLQTPVVLLSEQYLQESHASVEPFDVAAVTIDRGKLIPEGDVSRHDGALGCEGRYLRYKLTEDGVSWRALPGVRGASQVVNSYEHDEYGHAEEGAQMRALQEEKRMKKLDLARTLVPPPAYFGPEEADVSVVLFGATKLPVLEARDWLEASGVAVNVMQVVTLWPFPTDEVRAFLGAARRSLVVEGNYSGQLEGLIRQHALLEVDEHLRRYDGRPFSPEQVFGKVLAMVGRGPEEAAAPAPEERTAVQVGEPSGKGADR